MSEIAGSTYYDDDWDDDDTGDEDFYCSAPGRGNGGLCSDDMCRGLDNCMYEGPVA